MNFDDFVQLIQTSAHDTVLADGIADLIVCSPPYYVLRDYAGDQGIEWPDVTFKPISDAEFEITIKGCDPDCDHVWGDELPPHAPRQVDQTKHTEKGTKGVPKQGKDSNAGHICQKCGGWRGDLGQEPTRWGYIGHLILIFREMHRLLKPTGQLWVNLGDSYAGSGGAHTGDHANPGISKSASRDGYTPDGGRGRDKGGDGHKPKDKMNIPHAFAEAMKADGWWWRSDPPWLKHSGMPDSCKDRPTITHEWWFQFTKSQKYFASMYSVRRIAKSNHGSGNGFKRPERISYQNADGTPRGSDTPWEPTEKRFWRSVDVYHEQLMDMTEWAVNARYAAHNTGMVTSPDGTPIAMYFNNTGYKGGHFAAYPPRMIEDIVLFSTSSKGCCSQCGAPWFPVIGEVGGAPASYNGSQFHDQKKDVHRNQSRKRRVHKDIVGWEPGCECGAEIVPAVVLDPFNGTGSSGVAAVIHGRRYVGLDLHYQHAAEERIRAALGMEKTPEESVRPAEAVQIGLFA